MSKELHGAISLWSNSYGVNTGYGQQAVYIIDRLKRSGLEVSNISNFGLQGIRSKIQTPYGEVEHFPAGYEQYSQDTAAIDHMFFVNSVADKENYPNVFMTLYDVWMLNSPHYDKLSSIWSLIPEHHVSLPPAVKNWATKSNVTPLAISPWGKELFEMESIDSIYVPHSIDTSVFKENYILDSGEDSRDFFDSRNKFLVGMVADNKAFGLAHRKSYFENLMAFSKLCEKHDDVLLYLHTHPTGYGDGWDLPLLISEIGIPADKVIFPNTVHYRYGISQNDMSAYYSAMDVILGPSMGEGFGLPILEAQSCSTRSIGSSWAASKDLVSDDGWLVDGELVWDSNQSSWLKKPIIDSIFSSLEEAYKLGKTKSVKAREKAKQFDVEKIWEENWMPLLQSHFV